MTWWALFAVRSDNLSQAFTMLTPWFPRDPHKYPIVWYLLRPFVSPLPHGAWSAKQKVTLQVPIPRGSPPHRAGYNHAPPQCGEVDNDVQMCIDTSHGIHMASTFFDSWARTCALGEKNFWVPRCGVRHGASCCTQAMAQEKLTVINNANRRLSASLPRSTHSRRRTCEEHQVHTVLSYQSYVSPHSIFC